MKQRPALLKSQQLEGNFVIKMQLQNQETAEFHFSNRDTAYSHFEQLRFSMVLGHKYIKDIKFYDAESASI